MHASSQSAAPPARRMIAGGALATAAAQAAGLAALGLASIVLGRALGAGGFGTFAVALTLQSFVAGLSSVGLSTGIAYEIATGRWAPSSALRHAVVASLVLGCLGALLEALLLLVAGDDLLPGVSTVAVCFLLAAIPMGVIGMVMVGVILSLERYEAAAALQAAQPIGIAVLSSALAIPMGLDAAVAAIGAAVLLVGLVTILWTLRLASKLETEGGGSEGNRLREAARFGTRTWASDLLGILHLRADLVLVGALAGSQQAGLYGVAATITSIGIVIPQALAQVLLPRVASLTEAPVRDDEDATVTIARAGRQAVLFALVTSVALAVGILLIPAVYGSEFDDSVVLGLILIPGVAAFGISRMLAYALAGIGEPDLLLRLSALTTLPTMAIFVALIPSTEALGAAIISTISYAVTLMAVVWGLRNRAGIRPAALLLPRRSDLSVYPEVLGAARAYARSLRSGETSRAGTG